ncbi:hypothetical protein ACFSCV_10450 [Methylopila henanensis]|uniref:TonB-dependent receptor plug domain-containing protein n=1 Tax=Methylopila henanensis TaxID=873516 RepID=A0ABW4K5I0_9HYPH
MSFIGRLPLAIAFAASIGLVGPASGQSSDDDGGATQLETITVFGSEPDLKDVLSPGEVSVVYPDDVKGEHKALPDLLDQIPGVYARRVAGTGQYTTSRVSAARRSAAPIIMRPRGCSGSPTALRT